MNFLTFVFALLLIFSFGTFLTLEKASGNRRIRSSYLGHVNANRKILSSAESELYQSLKGEIKQTSTKNEKATPEEKEKSQSPINPDCSRVNLWNLIQDGKEKEPFLYETALKMIDHFYGNEIFKDKPQGKVDFLNALIKNARQAIQKKQFSLEKLKFDSTLQLSFYRMLKGTKVWDAEQKIGYPSFLDIFKIEENPSKICLLHAHPGQMRAIFGNKVGALLYTEIHEEKPAIITKELIEKIYGQSHLIAPVNELYDIIEMGKANHSHQKKTTFIAEDSDNKINLRKTVYFN